MSVTKVNKSQLSSLTTDIMSKVSNVNNTIINLEDVLKNIPNHSEFSSLVSKASLIASSIEGIYTDLEHVTTNMNTYVNGIIEIDGENLDETNDTVTSENLEVTNTTTQIIEEKTDWTTAGNVIASTLTTIGTSYYGSSSNTSSSNSFGNYTYSYSTGPTGTIVYTNNFSSSLLSIEDYDVSVGGKYNYEGIESMLENVDGVTVTLPSGLGSVHSYMGWQCITATSSKQYKLREVAGMSFDEEGFAKIGDRYVVAVTTTFGNVGDYIDVYQEDGTVIKCIIGDIKNQNDAGCTVWGHNNGQCVVEFVVNKSIWYGNSMHANPGTATCHPEWNQNITKIVNKGNYFNLIKTDAAKFEDISSEDTTLVTV